MSQINISTYEWLASKHLLPSIDLTSDRVPLDSSTTKLFFSGNKIGEIVTEIFKHRGQDVPENLTTLKKNPQPAGQLYNWNLLNQSLRKLGFQIDSQMKTAILSGQWSAIQSVLTQLQNVDDTKSQSRRQSNNRSLKEESPKLQKSQKQKVKSENIDILDYVIQVLSTKLKLTKKQAVALIADNNRYLAHVFVKGVKGSYLQIQQILQTFYEDLQMIIDKIVQSQDVGDFFLQMIKPSILSKSQDVALWGCKILAQTAQQLMKKELLPLGYQWLIKQNGGLSTAILCLSRHPKLSENCVNFILQFGRFNISQLLTIQLRKFCPDNLNYLKFLLQIFEPVVSSKLSSQQILNSGALDYWIEQAEKGADNDSRNSPELRVVSVQLLCKIWKTYPLHIQDTLGLANNIMNYFKKGIRDSSSIIRLNLLQQLFELLVHFARLKNPFASVIYKKLTFMFIQNHQITDFRQMILRNFSDIFDTFTSIPVDIFLQPFVKQLKISEGKTYILNISDMQFIISSIQHHKLKATTAVELIDFLAKTYLNDPVFWKLTYDSIQILCQRFTEDQSFLDYLTKLVKVCLALFISSMKLRKSKDDQTRLAMQKRSQIVMLLLMLVKLGNQNLNQQIKVLTMHTKIQIKQQYKYQHDGITQILSNFGNVYQIEKQVLSQSKSIEIQQLAQATRQKKTQPLKLPKINQRPQQSDDGLSQASRVSKSRKSNISTESRKKYEFPIKDYAQFETQQQRNFLQHHGIGLKKKKQDYGVAKLNKQFNIRQAIKDSSLARERRQIVSNTAKVIEQIDKIKQKKIQQQMRKAKQQQIINKKKQILKQKIKRQMQQRTVAIGKISDKNVQARVFEENQINEKLLGDHKLILNDIQQEQERDKLSIELVFQKSQFFLKKLFTKYQNASELKKKQVFDSNGQLLHYISQVDCIRMFKQKGVQKSKTTIQEMLKLIIKKSQIIHGVNYNHFIKLLQQYAIYSYNKSLIEPLGDHLKEILKKLAQGQNFKVEQEQDQKAKQLTHNLKQDPQMQIPHGYKKITQPNYHLQNTTTHMNLQILPQAYVYCYQIINELINQRFKVKSLQSNFVIKDETKVVKKVIGPPPRMIRRGDQTPVQQQKQTAPQTKSGVSQDRSIINRMAKIPSMLKRQVKTLQKRMNSVQKMKRQTQEQRKQKQEVQQKLRKARALQLKKKLDQQNQQLKLQKQKKKQQQKEKKKLQQQKAKKDKQQKQQYLKQQKQKIEKYKRQQQQNIAQSKKKKQEQDKKVQDQRKENLKDMKKKKDEKLKSQQQKNKHLKEQKQQQQKQKKQQDEKRKELTKKLAKKKIDEDKQKLQNDKFNKETLKKLYDQKNIQDVFSSFKQQLKALYAFGTQFNVVKVGTIIQGIQLKGWLAITQGFQLCDINNATLIFKNLMKDYTAKTITMPIFQQNLLNFSCKNLIDSLKDSYEQLVIQSQDKLKSYLTNLGIPVSKAKHKQFFQHIKTSKRVGQKQIINKDDSKSKSQIQAADPQQMQEMEHMQVQNPDGQKQKWGVK